MRGLRIIWAIAAKDIRATLTNKLALSIVLGSAMIMLSNAALPLLLRVRDTPVAIVYDQGRSTIIRGLAASDDLRLGVVDSLEEMQEIISESAEVIVGIVIPAGFDELAGSTERIELDGYAVHWGDSAEIEQRIVFFETQLGLATWGSVGIDLAPDRIRPSGELGGQLAMTSMMYVFVMLSLGIMLVPLLMVEERQNHTLEMLLVSPANIYQVISGKMVAGAFYGVLGASVVFLLTRYLVVHWWIALLAALLSVLFTISVGMLVGVLSDSPTTAGMWGSFFMVTLMGATIITELGSIPWPPLVESILQYLPSTAMIKLFGMALLGEIAWTDLLVNSAVLFSSAALFLGFAIWVARRKFR
jgi:ABC-type Na+ efflux pump permease subunit